MRRSPVALVAVAGAVLAAACVGDRETTAPAVRTAGSSVYAAGGGAACNFNAMKSDARAFLASPKDTIFAIITDMQDPSLSSSGRTAKGLDILAQIAKKRLTAAQGGTAVDGGNLVLDIASTSCTDLRVGMSATAAGEFNPAAALAGGVFEVRGDGSAPAAVAFVPGASTRGEASPRWGIEPNAGCSFTGPCTWPPLGGSQHRYLLTAYPTNASLLGEAAAYPTSFAGDNGFVVGMMPDIGDKSVFTVGTCNPLLVKSGTTSVGANLPVHINPALPTGIEILPNRSPTFCGNSLNTYPPQAMLPTRTWYASFANRALSILTPTLAYADDFRSDDFSGGGPSGWSPVSFARVTGSGVSPAFGLMPKNGVVGQNLVFTVHVGTAAGHGVPGVNVTVSVGNNSGSPAGAFVSAGGTDIKLPTNSNGDANFSIIVNKPGGYVLTATGSLGGIPTNFGTSALFNVKQQH